MSDDSGKFSELTLAAEDLTIPEREVRKLGRCGPEKRWLGAIRDAIAEARSLVEPRARWMALEGDPSALFPSTTPVERIVSEGESWLFVATIGEALETRVRALFDDAHYLDAVLLDAAGSTAVEAVCDRVEARCAEGMSSSRFSPGYCSWALEGQRPLHERLETASFGIELLPSLLMKPLKSVSGVVVRAAPQNLQVPASACANCDARGCTRRRSAPPGRSNGGRAA